MNNYFLGIELPKTETNERISYDTLAKTFNHVLCNDIIADMEEWELYNGEETSEDTDDYNEYFQYYIIDSYGAKILKTYTNETVWYDGRLNIYVWGVQHWGTDWKYVMLDIYDRTKFYE